MTNRLFGSEGLIGINVMVAANWLASQRCGGNKDSMSNDGQALNLQRLDEL